jgi:hypothetical protein
MITCPETDRPVYTHLNHNWNTLEAARFDEEVLECPYCGREHAWGRQDAYLDEAGGGG